MVDDGEVGGPLGVRLKSLAFAEVGGDVFVIAERAVGDVTRFDERAAYGTIGQVRRPGDVYDEVWTLGVLAFALPKAEDEGAGGSGGEAGCAVDHDVCFTCGGLEGGGVRVEVGDESGVDPLLVEVGLLCGVPEDDGVVLGVL